MKEPVLSRRTFLAVAGLSTAALVTGCDITTIPITNVAPTSTPNPSPAATGHFQVAELILGESSGTQGLLQPFTPDDFNQPFLLPFQICQDGQPVDGPLPKRVLAKVYYPYFAGTDHRVPTPNPLHLIRGPFPVLLYAHGFRPTLAFACDTVHPPQRDFTSVDALLRHVASYGCVCVAPDLSWLPGGELQESPLYGDTLVLRARLLIAYYQYLATLNRTLFANQLDLFSVVLVGHSTGGGAVAEAGARFAGEARVLPKAYGLIAPTPLTSSADVRNLLVLKGSLDTVQVRPGDPLAAYNAGGLPKTFVTIPGANHFGYTDLCAPDNHCSNLFGGLDNDATISLGAQQQTAAAYLAAMVRFYVQGDASMRPYLTGEQMVPELAVYDAQLQGIQVQSAGLPLSTPTPSRPSPVSNQ